MRTLSIAFLALIIASCAPNHKTSTTAEEKCTSKDGYWYKGECWKNFDDTGIPISEIDSVVEAQMKIINNSFISINKKREPLVAFLPIEEDEKTLLFIAVYGSKDLGYKTLIIPTSMKDVKENESKAKVLLFKGNALGSDMEESPSFTGDVTIQNINMDNLRFNITGDLTKQDSTESIHISFETNEAISGAGNSNIEIKGNEAFISGDLGTVTYAQMKDLIQNHPEIKTLVLTQISGSVNDDVNMHTGRIVREHGFTTKVLKDSDIASGGVDLFCAGKERIVVKGAKIGIHSWCCVDDQTAIEISKNHPAHQYQLEYFTMMMGDSIGPAFYFHTLSASPFDGIHYMSDEEIQNWTVSTQFIEE